MGMSIKLENALVLVLACLSGCIGLGAQAKAIDYNEVIFTCGREESVLVRFYPSNGSAILVRDEQTFDLKQEPAGSGFLYTNRRVSIRGKGEDMSIEVGHMAPIKCHAQ